MSRRPKAITSSIVVMSIVVGMGTLGFLNYLITSGMMAEKNATSVAVKTMMIANFAIIMTPAILDIIFLSLRRNWAHILNLVLIGGMIVANVVAAIFIGKGRNFVVILIISAVAVGLLAWLFVALLSVPKKGYFRKGVVSKESSATENGTALLKREDGADSSADPSTAPIDRNNETV
jgi:hypothetical protein